MLLINVNNFVNTFLNNKLEVIQDQFIFGEDINAILDAIKKKKGNNFNLEYIIRKMIVDTSYYLPLMSKSLIQIYFFDQKLVYWTIKNIYKKHYYHKFKDFSNLLIASFNWLGNTINKNYKQIQIKKWKEQNIKQEYQINNFKFYQLSLQQLKQIYLFISQSLTHINCNDVFTESFNLLFIYHIRLQCNNYKDQKIFVNAIARLIIHDFIKNKNEYFDDNRQDQYLQTLDTVISNWNLVYPRYQLIIKKNIEKWLNAIIKISPQQKEDEELFANTDILFINFQRQKEILINLIQKL